jgi:hypothetical protein
MKHDLDVVLDRTPVAWLERADHPATGNGFDVLLWLARRRPRPAAQPLPTPWPAPPATA